MLTLASFSNQGLELDHLYENEFNLRVNDNSLSYERRSTRTRFEKRGQR